MKTLEHFLYEQEIKKRLPHVYLDMDGVLVNLEKGAMQVHGKPLSQVPKPMKWEKISKVEKQRLVSRFHATGQVTQKA